MNQQPFEEWLFSDEPLSTEQEEQVQAFLEEHPQEARLAAAWRSLQPNLAQPEVLAPQPGFSERWLQRWETQRAQQERRRAMWLSLVSGLFALATAVPLGIQLWSVISEPTDWLVGLVDVLADFWPLVKLAMVVTGGVVRTIPLPLWGALLTSLMGLVLLWSVAYNRFVLAQGATR